MSGPRTLQHPNKRVRKCHMPYVPSLPPPPPTGQHRNRPRLPRFPGQGTRARHPPYMPPSRRRKGSTGTAAGDLVLAASAGENTWRTWAGRSGGGDGFEALDLFRGLRRSFREAFVWTVPPPGTACPVCFCIPEEEEDGSGGGRRGRWHVTSACGHAVCVACLRAYAAAQVDDPDQAGPLRCCVCPMPLREGDAVAALGHDPAVLGRWDAKIRDQLLRALPSYRHCPNCREEEEAGAAAPAGGGGGRRLGGGGFVTPECLAPVNSGREAEAEAVLSLRPRCDWAIYLCYLLYASTYGWSGTGSISVSVLNVYFVPAWLVHRARLLAHMLVARWARRALYRPIEVGCPCCGRDFVLNAEAELSPDGNPALGDAATARWIGTNCRPCPSCSVPIAKASGCNHMRCSRCGAGFCWACMRLRTRCAAFDCRNGAPYGNAPPPGGPAPGGWLDGGEGENLDSGTGTVAERLERLERRASDLSLRDLATLAALCGTVVWRDAAPVRTISLVLVTAFSVVFSTGFAVSALVLYLLLRPVLDRALFHPRGRPRPRPRPRRAGGGGGGMVPGRGRMLDRAEEAMLAEAMARSLRER